MYSKLFRNRKVSAQAEKKWIHKNSPLEGTVFRSILTVRFRYRCFSLPEQAASLDYSCTTAAGGLIIAAAIRYPPSLPRSLFPHHEDTYKHALPLTHAPGCVGCGAPGGAAAAFTSPVAKHCLTERLRLCQNVDGKPPSGSPAPVTEALCRISRLSFASARTRCAHFGTPAHVVVCVLGSA